MACSRIPKVTLTIALSLTLAGCGDGPSRVKDAEPDAELIVDAGGDDDAGHDDAGHDDASHDDASHDDASDPGTPTPCKDDLDCGARSQFCLFEEGTCRGEGICVARPKACAPTREGVCGCDGEDYASEECAHAKGVNVAHPGECGEPRRCETNKDCARHEFCAEASGPVEPVDACGAAGECAPRPTCEITIPATVCGCDGKEYGSQCEANAAGVRAYHCVVIDLPIIDPPIGPVP